MNQSDFSTYEGRNLVGLIAIQNKGGTFCPTAVGQQGAVKTLQLHLWEAFTLSIFICCLCSDPGTYNDIISIHGKKMFNLLWFAPIDQCRTCIWGLIDLWWLDVFSRHVRSWGRGSRARLGQDREGAVLRLPRLKQRWQNGPGWNPTLDYATRLRPCTSWGQTSGVWVRQGQGTLVCAA